MSDRTLTSVLRQHRFCFNPDHIEAAGSAGADPRWATTRGNLAQALLATDLIDRLMEYAREANPDTMQDEDRQQVAWSWASRIGDWLDQANGSWRAQGGPSLDVERLAEALRQLEARNDLSILDDGDYPDFAEQIAAEYARLAPADPVEET